MKRLIITLVITVISSTAYPQLTLTNSINPVPGDSMWAVYCDTLGISPGNPGANQTWDFTNLLRRDSIHILWVATSSTPYGGQFPSSNVASTADNVNFGFSISSDSSLVTIGSVGGGTIYTYSDPQIFLKYPFTYNSSFTDNYAAAGSNSVIRTGTISLLGDAYGNIILPTGSFPNSLRLRTTMTRKDSSSNTVIFTNYTAYNWYTQGKKQPVFGINYSSTSINGGPSSYVKIAAFNTNIPPTGIRQLGTTIPSSYKLFQNYPNPFNPLTKIKFDIPNSEFVRIRIYDELGQLVSSLLNQYLNSGSYELEWDAAKFSSGVYFYNMETNSFTASKRMILIK